VAYLVAVAEFDLGPNIDFVSEGNTKGGTAMGPGIGDVDFRKQTGSRIMFHDLLLRCVSYVTGMVPGTGGDETSVSDSRDDGQPGKFF
jgi:hypothetical protein